MRIAAAILVSALVVAGPAFAGEPSSGAKAEEVQPASKSKSVQLDEFFKKLTTEKDEVAAKLAESSIIRLWMDSGSDTVDLLMNWSLQAMEDKDYSLALDYLDRVTTLKPDFAEGWNKRATVYFLKDDYAKAIADIRKTLRLEPRHFGALSGLGIILADLGDNHRAIEAYEQALALDPYLTNVRDALKKLQKEAERNI
jgi:tetratricopeptide (TPR) repeat protein